MRLAALALLLLACSSQPSASASPSPWSCRLAVVQGTKDTGFVPGNPGFLSLPGLSFSPALDAGDGRFYDRPLKRWVPMGPPALSEDGLLYAYVDGDQTSTRLHLVDLKSNIDRILAQGGPWRVVGVQPDAVYIDLIKYLPYSEAYGVLTEDQGLWKVPPDGGPPVELSSDPRGWLVAGGAAWGGGYLDIAGGPNDIVRLDLHTMKVTTWFKPGKRSRILAVDSAGVPLILAEAADEEVWSVPAPAGAVEVWSGPGDGPRPEVLGAVDGGVTWFTGGSLTSWTIYRYSSRGLEIVATFTDPVMVAGPCA